MATVATKTTCTPEELLAMPDGDRFELVGGHLMERNVSTLSSWVGGRVFSRMNIFCDARDLGLCWPADHGFQCFPDDPWKVRRPDAAFIRRERLPADLFHEDFTHIAPDLAVEVLSPNDLVYDVDVKVAEYQAAGVRLVWVINPQQRTVRVHRLDGSFGWLTERDELDGEDVMPGFRCPVRDLFPASAV